MAHSVHPAKPYSQAAALFRSIGRVGPPDSPLRKSLVHHVRSNLFCQLRSGKLAPCALFRNFGFAEQVIVNRYMQLLANGHRLFQKDGNRIRLRRGLALLTCPVNEKNSIPEKSIPLLSLPALLVASSAKPPEDFLEPMEAALLRSVRWIVPAVFGIVGDGTRHDGFRHGS